MLKDNKRGQEMSITTLMLIVLGVIVVVVVIMAVSGVFGPIFSGLKLAPSGLGTLVKACDGYVQIDSKTDYCTFRDVTIDGKTEYLSCADSRVQEGMDQTLAGRLTCNTDDVKDECTKLIKSGVKNPVVNKEVCTKVSCTGDDGLNGALVGADDKCPTSGSNTKLIRGDLIVQGKCCVAP